MQTYVKEVHLISAPSRENSNYALYAFSFVFHRVWTAAQITASHANTKYNLFHRLNAEKKGISSSIKEEKHMPAEIAG